MTLDGFCNHTAVTPSEELHHRYANLLNKADAALYGRITYQLMEYWRTVLENPTDDPSANEFAVAIDKIPKIVFSRSLKKIDWESAKLAKKDLEAEVLQLKQSRNNVRKDILVCSPSLIVALTNLHLIDEYQLCIHPVVAGGGLPLFKNIQEKVVLKLIRTKTLDSGAVMLCYEPVRP